MGSEMRPGETANLGVRKSQLAIGVQYALIFALGFQTMVLELTLPRLLAPAFGNTLFCWTAAIGEVLAALAIGYHIGGILSSKPKARSPWFLWWLAATSSGWVILTAVSGDRIVKGLYGYGMITGPLLGTLVLAVPPAMLGAALLPICVANLSESAGSGKYAGRLYAFSTVGSVLGVLLTGYLLLPLLGVPGALYTAAGFVFFWFLFARQRVLGIAGLVIILLAAIGVANTTVEQTLMDKSNGYHRIRVVADKRDTRIRRLYLDSSLEGAVRIGSVNPGIAYQREGVKIAMQLEGLKRCFFLGGGSFSMPQFLKAKRPDMTIDVVEIDPDVVVAARSLLALSSGVQVWVGDARRILSERTTKYDLIVNDAFHGLRKIPFHLVTQQFNQIVAERLSARGIYAVNVIGDLKTSRLVNSMVRTLKQHFQWVHHYDRGDASIRNRWLLASNASIPIGQAMSIESGVGMILTDQHAPVEFLIMTDILAENKTPNSTVQ